MQMIQKRPAAPQGPHPPLRRKLCALTMALCALTVATPVWGQSSSDKLEIHGFGGWAFADTDGNRYLLGDEDGNYDTAEFSLNVTAKPVENLSIVAQIRLERDRTVEDVALDYAFAEWFFSDAARIRFGRVKHPYGLYAEIFDVGTLRPFYFLPQGIYGKQGITANNYDGIGLKGTRFIGRWGLDYDVYVGQIESEIGLPGPLSARPQDFLQPVVDSTSQVDDVLGARLNVLFPVEGLKVGVSGYIGSQQVDEVLAGFARQGDDREDYGAHLEYASRPLLIRAEYAHDETESVVAFDSYYLEVAYHLGRHWQVAGRYDHFELEFGEVRGPGAQLPPFFDHVSQSEEVALGLNYWFNPNLVLRLSYHRVEGNRFAFPEDPADIQNAFFNNVIETETDMILFGAQFSF